MSVEDVKKIKSAYEQMLEDGSAFAPVDMTMTETPSLETAKSSLGEKIETQQPKQENIPTMQEKEFYNNPDTDYTDFDSHMQQRINSLKAKAAGIQPNNKPQGLRNEVLILKKRMAKLEEALMIVMETHEKLLG